MGTAYLSSKVVVIGAGVIGLSTAYYCRLLGHEVVVVSDHIESADGCSFGNSGMIVPSHFTPLAAPGMIGLGLRMMLHGDCPFSFAPKLNQRLIRWSWLFWRNATRAQVECHSPLLLQLNLASRSLYEELEEVLPDFGLTKTGLLMLCKTQQALDHEATVAVKARELGLKANVLSGSELKGVDPQIDMDVAGGVHFSQDCRLIPDLFMQGLREKLVSLGVPFKEGEEVVRFTKDGHKVRMAHTRDGEFEADQFVIATGTWSTDLLKTVGFKLPLVSGKGYNMTLPTPRQMPALCSILTEARVAVTPMGHALRFGGTMELGATTLNIDEERVNGMVKSIPQYFPQFRESDFQDQRVWSGFRPCSPDGMPFIGNVPGMDNLWVGTGHGMMGMSLGPISGKLLSQVISGMETDIPITELRLARF